MTEMEPDRKTAERAIREAYKSNPGVAEACKNIASHCKGLSGEKAYVLGLLHDIGRYAGVSSEKHLIDGYRYCAARGWKKAAQICISHAFMIQDINTSIGTFDVSGEDYLFMKNFVENAVYDAYDRLVLQLKAFFEKKAGCSNYELLPGVVENSFRQEESHV